MNSIYLFMLGFKELIKYSSIFTALDLNPDYMKVRLRRAQCYEHEDRLEEALEGKKKTQRFISFFTFLLKEFTNKLLYINT